MAVSDKEYQKLEGLVELLVDFGNVMRFDDFQKFADGRKQYGDTWCHYWPKNAVCENCQTQFDLHPENLNGAYISGEPFDNQSQYHWHRPVLRVVIECPACQVYFKYVSD